MRYEKPFVMALDVAANSIRGGEKDDDPPNDNKVLHTIGAYEADE